MQQKISVQSNVWKFISGLVIISWLFCTQGLVLANGHNQVSVKLAHAPNGSSQLSWNSTTKDLTVTTKLTGLQPNSVHPAQIHQGTDCASNGPVLYNLNDVVADKAGNSTSTTVLHNITSGIPQTGWYIKVHSGPTLESDGGKGGIAVACGTVTNNNASTAQSQSVVTNLGATTDENQSASGTATLELKGQSLVVTLNQSHLVPGSVHAAHIHAGSCENQVPGSILYTLNNVVADNNGNGSSVTTIQSISQIPQTGWYINVHFGTDLSTQVGFDAIACGNVVP